MSFGPIVQNLMKDAQQQGLMKGGPGSGPHPGGGKKEKTSEPKKDHFRSLLNNMSGGYVKDTARELEISSKGSKSEVAIINLTHKG